MNNITANQFETYEEIRQSGITNMFDINRVCELSYGYLTKQDCLTIMQNYSELKEKYGYGNE